MNLTQSVEPPFHSPERIVDERVTHEIVRRADYNLHIVRPVYLDVEFASRNAAAVLFIHGGGWTIGDVSMNFRKGVCVSFRFLRNFSFGSSRSLSPE